MILLETYSTKSGKELIDSIPPFLEYEKETTGDPAYSMFNLSLKAEWSLQNFEKKKVNCVRNFFANENVDCNGTPAVVDATPNNENGQAKPAKLTGAQTNGTSR